MVRTVTSTRALSPVSKRSAALKGLRGIVIGLRNWTNDADHAAFTNALMTETRYR